MTFSSSVKHGIWPKGWGFDARSPIFTSSPTSLAPQLTRGDREPCDPYRVRPAMARLVDDAAAAAAAAISIVDCLLLFLLILMLAVGGANAEELQATEARRRNESANFMVMPMKVLGF